MTEIIQLIEDDEIHFIRNKGSVSALKLYAEMCYPSMVGKQQWKVQHCHVALTALVTVANEALAALIVENNFKEWVKRATTPLDDIDMKNRQTKYTHGGVDAKGTKKGWSIEGRMRFNAFYDEIKRARNTERNKSKEEELTEIWLLQDGGGQNGRYGRDTTIIDAAMDDERRQQMIEESFVPRTEFD